MTLIIFLTGQCPEKSMSTEDPVELLRTVYHLVNCHLSLVSLLVHMNNRTEVRILLPYSFYSSPVSVLWQSAGKYFFIDIYL